MAVIAIKHSAKALRRVRRLSARLWGSKSILGAFNHNYEHAGDGNGRKKKEAAVWAASQLRLSRVYWQSRSISAKTFAQSNSAAEIRSSRSDSTRCAPASAKRDRATAHSCLTIALSSNSFNSSATSRSSLLAFTFGPFVSELVSETGRARVAPAPDVLTSAEPGAWRRREALACGGPCVVVGVRHAPVVQSMRPIRQTRVQT